MGLGLIPPRSRYPHETEEDYQFYLKTEYRAFCEMMADRSKEQFVGATWFVLLTLVFVIIFMVVVATAMVPR